MAMTRLGKSALVVGTLAFLVFVWPTPFRIDGRRKTNRVEFVLGDLWPKDAESFLGALTWLFIGFVFGATVMYLVLRRSQPTSRNP